MRRGVEGEDPWVDAGGGSLAGNGSLSRDAADSGLKSGHTWKVMNMSLQNDLMEAAELGDYDGLVRAIQMGANLDTGEQTPYTVSALHLAARGNRLGAIQQLLLHGLAGAAIGVPTGDGGVNWYAVFYVPCSCRRGLSREHVRRYIVEQIAIARVFPSGSGWAR